MKIIPIILGMCCLIFLSACQTELMPADLVRHIVDVEHGLRKIKQVKDLEVDVQFKPVDFMIAQEFRSNHINEEDYKKRMKALEPLQYYNLKIGVTDGKSNITNYQVADEQALQDRLYYLSFRIKEDIGLIQGKDTLLPVLCHFERNYGLSQQRTFVLAFPKGEVEADRTFILDSKELNTGPIKMKFNEKDINNTPCIKLQ